MMSGDNRGWNDDAEMPDLNALASDRSTEFGQMMQHAIRRLEESASQRTTDRLFERKPDFVKNTLFHCMPRKTGPNGELGDITEEQKMIMRARESTSFEANRYCVVAEAGRQRTLQSRRLLRCQR